MDDYEYDYDYEGLYLPPAAVASKEQPAAEGPKETTFQMVFDSCIQPSVISILPNIVDLMIYNLIFNILTQTKIIPKEFNHLVSLVSGAVLLGTMNCPIKFCIFVSFVAANYMVVYGCHKICKGYNISSTTYSMVVLMCSLLFCEFYFPYKQKWLEIRGIIMILVMKSLSVAHDFESSRHLPPVLEFLGYACCPANCMFGPWISFAEYCSIFRRPHKKNIWWIISVLTTLVIALFFLSVSNCWSDYFLQSENKVIQCFKMALTFRTSHYFISYLSEMGMILAGYKDPGSNRWSYPIVHPLKVEFPSSLVSVVTNWNIPMHMFLKKYIYRKILPLGKFCAILVTYFVSSLLHGFNIEIAVVLLSIGLFSYIQLRFQDKLSEDLDACIQIRACRHCNHKYKRSSFLVTVLSIVFGILTVVHLAYLGQLMDVRDNPYSPSILKKWDNVQYCSHIIMFFAYLYCLS